MPVTIVNRPYGHKLNDTVLSATVSNSSGDALFTTAFSHALIDGDYIYVDSNFESFNGFKYVDRISSTTFKLRNGSGDYAISFKQTGTISYQASIDDHGWLAVHNPIVYELRSDVYPVNLLEEGYTPVSVAASSNSNGYTAIELTGPLTTPIALTYISIGQFIYQIIKVTSPSEVVIDLAFDADNDLSGAVLKYYNNYTINVSIYLGLDPIHRWEALKPYELVSTLRLIPDGNNRVKFSISEIVKTYIETRNNLTLDTLPNNLDFYTQFYIVHSESYDTSLDGTTLQRVTVGENDDKVNFQGHAVNAMMPFKSKYINAMSDYIVSDTQLAKWLVLQERPMTVIGRFFDMSFINSIESEIDIQIIVNGELFMTLTNPGTGVIRVPLDFSVEGEYCIYAYTPGAPEIIIPAPPPEPVNALNPLSAWLTRTEASRAAWTTGITNPVTTLNSAGDTVSEFLYQTYAFVPGTEYTVTIEASRNVTGTDGSPRYLKLGIYQSSLFFLDVDASASAFTSAGSKGTTSLSLTFTAVSGDDRIGIQTQFTGEATVTVTSAIMLVPGTPGEDTIIPAVPAQQITEMICVDVIDECTESIIPNMGNLRLLETGEGNFRELE